MINDALERRNHGSIRGEENIKTLGKLIKRDIEYGFAIPITRETTLKIVRGEIYLLGVQHQFSTNINKERISNCRTHESEYEGARHPRPTVS